MTHVSSDTVLGDSVRPFVSCIAEGNEPGMIGVHVESLKENSDYRR